MMKSSEELREPLLPPSIASTGEKDGSSSIKNPYPSLWRLKVLSFVTGSITAGVSQAILSNVLWIEDVFVHQQPTSGNGASEQNESDGVLVSPSTVSVIVFSLMWSFWTCVMIFLTMVVLVRWSIGPAPKEKAINSNNKEKAAVAKQKQKHMHRLWEDTVFQMEAHHIVGALLSISAIWVAVDVLQSVFQHNSLNGSGITGAASSLFTSSFQNVLLLALGVAWYALFVRCILKKGNRGTNATDNSTRNKQDAMLSTYQLIASTLGLISGLCSQFLLSFILWKDNMTQPIVDHVVAFSILWSVCTVVMTFFGCLSLRLLTVEEEAEHDKIHAERIFLRMESHYIFCSLVGICSAWILIDLVMDMREQIFPSILMLVLSLAAFTGIIHCFPEDQCLADLQAEADATVAQVEYEKLLQRALLEQKAADGILTIQIV